MFRRLFINPDVPVQYRSNFVHLYFDIGWFGILSGSAAGFLGVYLTRLGAAGLHIGLLSATGAMVSLLLAIPAGRWLERRPVSRAVFWASIAQRSFYLLWIPLPWLLNAQGQIWAMISFAFLMAIPATALGVGFNALFASAVPPEWRAQVAGIREDQDLRAGAHDRARHALGRSSRVEGGEARSRETPGEQRTEGVVAAQVAPDSDEQPRTHDERREIVGQRHDTGPHSSRRVTLRRQAGQRIRWISVRSIVLPSRGRVSRRPSASWAAR